MIREPLLEPFRVGDVHVIGSLEFLIRSCEDLFYDGGVYLISNRVEPFQQQEVDLADHSHTVFDNVTDRHAGDLHTRRDGATLLVLELHVYLRSHVERRFREEYVIQLGPHHRVTKLHLETRL
jgi:hypothetical protein